MERLETLSLTCRLLSASGAARKQYIERMGLLWVQTAYRDWHDNTTALEAQKTVRPTGNPPDALD